MSCADGGFVRPGLPRGEDDYVRTVLLTELLADYLPRLPWYLRELQCALEVCSTDLEKVCVTLKTNPAICENFVHIGNMAEPAEPIRMPLDHLVVLLGKQRVWTVAVAAFLLAETNNNWSSIAKREVANIAMARAKAAVTRAKTNDDADLDQVYAAGVLSVIGLLPLVEASGVTDQVPEWIEVAAEAIIAAGQRARLPDQTTGEWSRNSQFSFGFKRKCMNAICALIIDDSSVMRKIVERSLRQAGIELSQVMEAGNGMEALLAIQQKRPDLILSDINMPTMNGLEFVKQLQSVAGMKDIPVIMITTEASESHVVEALSYGARGYIRKPFTAEQVKEHVLPLVKHA